LLPLAVDDSLLPVLLMHQLKIAGVLALAIALQSALAVWRPLVYIDIGLILVVYFALQREPVQALVVGAATGLAMDALSHGLMGAGGFSKTVTAYVVYAAASRVMLDTTLLRIPVLVSATLIDNAVYVAMNRMLGHPPSLPFVQVVSYKVIATSITGTILLYLYNSLFSQRGQQRRQFSVRRRVARRPGVLRRR
jgi:rod shape-determining protein MreD